MDENVSVREKKVLFLQSKLSKENNSNKLIEIGKERCRTPKGLLVEPRQSVRRQEGFQLETHKLIIVRDSSTYLIIILST